MVEQTLQKIYRNEKPSVALEDLIGEAPHVSTRRTTRSSGGELSLLVRGITYPRPHTVQGR